jgi:hypothetical protein
VPHVEPAIAHRCEQLVDFVARIDEHRLARLLAAHDKPVFEEGANGLTLNYHGQ